MLWIKALHIAFMVTWFAGLFYLPRLMIYHVEATDETSLHRFVVMERRLFAIMTIGAVLTAVFGIALLVMLGGLDAGLWQQGWWHVKLAGLVALIGYHGWCLKLMREIASGGNSHSSRWYRWFNEIPGALLLLIVIMVVVRPF